MAGRSGQHAQRPIVNFLGILRKKRGPQQSSVPPTHGFDRRKSRLTGGNGLILAHGLRQLVTEAIDPVFGGFFRPV